MACADKNNIVTVGRRRCVTQTHGVVQERFICSDVNQRGGTGIQVAEINIFDVIRDADDEIGGRTFKDDVTAVWCHGVGKRTSIAAEGSSRIHGDELGDARLAVALKNVKKRRGWRGKRLTDGVEGEITGCAGKYHKSTVWSCNGAIGIATADGDDGVGWVELTGDSRS